MVQALDRLGVKAELSGRNDITIAGQKISGNAQYIRGGRVMHHGTLLFDSDLGAVSRARQVSADKVESKGVKSVRARVTNIRGHLPEDIGMEQFISTLRQCLTEGEGLTPYELTAQDLAAVDALRRSRYDTWDWNYGASPEYSIRKQRRVENCGEIEIYLEVSDGVITAFQTFGDYFGSGDPADVARALIGCRPEQGALLSALSGLDVGHYFHNLSAPELTEIILI